MQFAINCFLSLSFSLLEIRHFFVFNIVLIFDIFKEVMNFLYHFNDSASMASFFPSMEATVSDNHNYLLITVIAKSCSI